jgi:hypothetical protein
MLGGRGLMGRFSVGLIAGVLAVALAGAPAAAEDDWNAAALAGGSIAAPRVPLSELDAFESRLEHAWEIGWLKPSLAVRGGRQGYEDAPAIIDELHNDANVQMNIGLPSWPMLSLSYSRQQRKLIADGWSGNLSDTVTNSADASLWYGLGKWETFASARMARASDPVRNGPDWIANEYAAMITYRPITTLALSIGGGLQRNRYGAGSDWLESHSATASLYYTHERTQMDFYLWGSFIENNDAFGSAASRNFDFALKIGKKLTEGWLPMPGTHSLGIEIGMSHYQDVLYPAFTSGAAIGRLVYRIDI